jgi:hypothetical protein
MTIKHLALVAQCTRGVAVGAILVCLNEDSLNISVLADVGIGCCSQAFKSSDELVRVGIEFRVGLVLDAIFPA